MVNLPTRFCQKLITIRMYKVKINRINQKEVYTIGSLDLYDSDGWLLFSCVSLERGWNDNKQNESCVPLGSYKCVKEYSDRFKKDLWELKDVSNRSECKFHSANYWHELNGCIALGLQVIDINNDGKKDITRSKPTMDIFHEILRHQSEIVVEIC